MLNSMKCPNCSFEQGEGNTECPRCGIIFSKFRKRPSPASPDSTAMTATSATGDSDGGMPSFMKELFFYVKPDINVFYFAGRLILYLVIFFWGWKFILTPMESNYAGRSFLHLINLPFHEAGHMIFRPFGRFVMMLGGSLMQLLIPLICLITFLLKSRDTFASSVSLWWLGESFMDLAPYINDARQLKLVLLGGVTGRDVADYHDWEFILRKLGWLKLDHMLANIAFYMGTALMIAAFSWAGYLLFRQFQNIDRG